jgi:hypothetical protein
LRGGVPTDGGEERVTNGGLHRKDNGCG